MSINNLSMKHSYQYQASIVKLRALGILCTVGILFSSSYIHASQALAVNSTVFKVMTFNVRHGTDLQGNGSIEKQLEFIKKHELDLLALQEIDQATVRANKELLALPVVLKMSFYGHIIQVYVLNMIYLKTNMILEKFNMMAFHQYL